MRNATRTGAYIEGSKNSFRPSILHFALPTFNDIGFTPVYSYTYIYSTASILTFSGKFIFKNTHTRNNFKIKINES
jgi:hypothetical protein